MWLLLIPAALCSLYCGTSPPPPPPAPTERIILLPNADGQPSSVVIFSQGKQQVLDQPYATLGIARDGAFMPEAADAAAVQQRYGELLRIQPPRATSYTVYFVSGKDELTPESLRLLEQVKQDLQQRPAPEIRVIGHTDDVGPATVNDPLSLQRAQRVRSVLVAAGVGSEASIEASGRGQREPLVKAGPQMAEPRNRRVEINVR